MIHQPQNLQDLLTYLREHGHHETDNAMTELPVYGGPEPLDTHSVWSWDETSLLVGDNVEEMQIVPRGEPVHCGLCTEYVGDAQVDDEVTSVLEEHHEAHPRCRAYAEGLQKSA